MDGASLVVPPAGGGYNGGTTSGQPSTADRRELQRGAGVNHSLADDRLVRVLLVLLVLLAAIFLGAQVWQLLQSVGDILMLFFLAWLVAFTLRPVARVLQRY